MIEVYLEIGTKRTFAGALAWPGWARSGRDEEAALQALIDYAPRYARTLEASFDFRAPGAVGELRVIERLNGNATTDFGAPGGIPEADAAPLAGPELECQIGILEGAWRALDRAMQDTAGVELRKGPRGGGRDHDGIARHVFEAERSYASQIGVKHAAGGGGGGGADTMADMRGLRSAIRDGLRDPSTPVTAPGRRPKKLWAPRYFVRRAAWHVLDHAWEIEDRAAPQ